MDPGKVLIVKNIRREGAGLFEIFLKELAIPYEIAELDCGEDFASPKNFKALIVLGGPDSANDSTPKMKNEIAKIQEALALGIPYLGICLGMQTLVKAAGGEAIKSSVKEIGFRDANKKLFAVCLTAKGKADPLFEGMRDSFPVFQLHGETVRLTSAMELLGTGDVCANQIVKAGKNAYGLQFHLELTRELLSVWHREDEDLKKVSIADLQKDFDGLGDSYFKNARQFFLNFLKLAGLLEKGKSCQQISAIF